MLKTENEGAGHGVGGDRPGKVYQRDEGRCCASNGWGYEVDILGSRARRTLEQINEANDGVLLRRAI